MREISRRCSAAPRGVRSIRSHTEESEMKLSALFPTFICALLFELAAPADDVLGQGFAFNGFRNATLRLDGAAAVTPEGLLRLTNASTTAEKAHAFHRSPLSLANKTTAGDHYSSFSTTFVFAIVPELPLVGSHGMAFVVSSSRDLPLDSSGRYLGLFNDTTADGLPSNRVVAVEFDVTRSDQVGDIDGNHVGIDVNSIKSNKSAPAGYFTNESSGRSNQFRSLTLASGDPMQAWVDYNGRATQLNVTLWPLGTPRPERPLLSAAINLSTVLRDPVYVGFSSSEGEAPTSHYVLGWSFQVNGEARPLEPSSLPSLPRRASAPRYKYWIKWLSVALSVLFTAALAAVAGGVLLAVRRIRFAEVHEDWEVEYGPHRFSYKDLYRATKGFADRELLGSGGFGRVYRGLLPTSGTPVAVKKITHDSRQGMREFIAEIVSLGRLRHRNLVQLLGYCRRRGELLLVYDLMPGGCLDRLLFDRAAPGLSWKQRFHVVKGVASGLLYLHEGWEQVVIHRDIKASNVLLDGEFNGRLGDFGLARLYDHGGGLETTHVVGTMGYLAPELVRTGKATKASDVFAFGAFLLEVACGRRPIERLPVSGENFVLVDWVLDRWRRGSILEAADARLVLAGESAAAEEEEVGMVMVLGLHCSHPLPSGRPSMRQVMQFLEGDEPLPELPLDYMMNSSFPAEQQDELLLQLLQKEEGCCSTPSLHMSYPSYCSTSSLSGPR